LVLGGNEHAELDDGIDEVLWCALHAAQAGDDELYNPILIALHVHQQLRRVRVESPLPHKRTFRLCLCWRVVVPKRPVRYTTRHRHGLAAALLELVAAVTGTRSVPPRALLSVDDGAQLTPTGAWALLSYGRSTFCKRITLQAWHVCSFGLEENEQRVRMRTRYPQRTL